ncbi:VanZ family protein [Flavobacterium hauense]
MRNKFLPAAVAWGVFVTYACLAGASSIPKASWLDIDNKDKIVHFIFHFVFTILLYKTYKAKAGSSVKAYGYAFLTAAVYGVIIEICQGLFTAERSADVLDALANMLGSLTAIFMLWLRQRLKK